MTAYKSKRLVCLTGLPLVGKSYVGRLLAARVPNSAFISCGDIARSLIKSSNELKAMEAIDLYPGEEELRAELKNKIETSQATCVIVDGFPRFADQANYLNSEFGIYFPIVVNIDAGDMQTLALRAKARARDARDTDQAEFTKRLDLAMKNQSSIVDTLNSHLIKNYTIISTADDDSILKQFKRIFKQKI